MNCHGIVPPAGSCLPPALGDEGAAILPRPAVTGTGLPQRSTTTVLGPAPGCVEGDGAPPALRCYAGQGDYIDQVGEKEETKY